MFMTNQGDYYFNKVILTDEKDITQAASCVIDSKTGDIILKLVNAWLNSKNMKIDLSRFGKIITDAEITILTGDAEAENTFENPNSIFPVKSGYKVKTNFEYNAPAMSLSVIRVKTK